MSHSADGQPVSEEALGQLFITQGLLSQSQYSKVLQVRQEQGGDEPLVLLLARLGLVSEHNIAQALAKALSLPLVQRDDFPVSALLPDKLSYRFLREYHLIPVSVSEQSIRLAMGNPQDRYAVDAVSLATGLSVERCIGYASDIDAAIELLYGEGQSSMGNIVAEVEPVAGGP